MPLLFLICFGSIGLFYLLGRLSRRISWFSQSVVQCWFCHSETKVPNGNVNCWDCPTCDQYNGFAKNGGYNKDIPAQHKEELNHSLPCKEISSTQHGFQVTARLCDTCNMRQEEKIGKLRQFSPISEKNFDSEYDIFSHCLNILYPLCDHCKMVVEAKKRYDNYKYHDLMPARQTDVHEQWIEGEISHVLLCCQLISLVMAVLTFTTLFYEVQVDSGTWFISSHLIPLIIHQIYSRLLTFITPLCALGLLSAIFTIIFSKALCLHWLDALNILLWLLLLTLRSDIILSPTPDTIILSFLIALLTLPSNTASFFIPRIHYARQGEYPDSGVERDGDICDAIQSYNLQSLLSPLPERAPKRSTPSQSLYSQPESAFVDGDYREMYFYQLDKSNVSNNYLTSSERLPSRVRSMRLGTPTPRGGRPSGNTSVFQLPLSVPNIEFESSSKISDTTSFSHILRPAKFNPPKSSSLPYISNTSSLSRRPISPHHYDTWEFDGDRVSRDSGNGSEDAGMS